jgi:hypothetical protein
MYYMYVCVCLCVCVYVDKSKNNNTVGRINTATLPYKYTNSRPFCSHNLFVK